MNEILEESEKLGGPKKDRRLLDDFRKALDDCDLRDLKPKGETYTWHGNRRGNHIWERLDRFLCNYQFDTMFADHRPIEVNLDGIHYNYKRRQYKPFKFEEVWTRHEACGEIIAKNGHWEGSNISLSSLSFDLNSCSNALSK